MGALHWACFGSLKEEETTLEVHIEVQFNSFNVKRGKLVTNSFTASLCIPVNRMAKLLSTYAEGALLGWPNGGWGGAGPAGWRSSMQHGFGPEKDRRQRFIMTSSLTAKVFKHYFPIIDFPASTLHLTKHHDFKKRAGNGMIKYARLHVMYTQQIGRGVGWETNLRYSRHEIA